ncbi:hypothetical protein ABBQ38_005540 [Trebouxia sp. C0009 RCD-2024]
MNHKERVLQELPPQATPKLVLRRQWLARQGFLTYNKAEQGGLAAAASYTRPGRRDTQWWAGVAKTQVLLRVVQHQAAVLLYIDCNLAVQLCKPVATPAPPQPSPTDHLAAAVDALKGLLTHLHPGVKEFAANGPFTHSAFSTAGLQADLEETAELEIHTDLLRGVDPDRLRSVKCGDLDEGGIANSLTPGVEMHKEVVRNVKRTTSSRISAQSIRELQATFMGPHTYRHKAAT